MSDKIRDDKGKFQSCNDRIGEVYYFPDGTNMTLIAYHRSDNIDVQFSDGTIVKNRRYENFIKGSITNPNNKVKSKVGEKRINTDGYEMKIIAYRASRDMDIKFSNNGAVREHVTYQNFKLGNIAHPSYVKSNVNKEKTRLGEKIINKQGLTLEIIRYGGSGDIDVKVLETDEIIVSRSYRQFLNGGIISKKYYANTYLNNPVMMNNGLYAKIIELRSSMDADYEFEDGVVVKNIPVRALRNRQLLHPELNAKYKSLYHGFEVCPARRDENAVYYKCRCFNCMDKQQIMTPQEMLQHKCDKEATV